MIIRLAGKDDLEGIAQIYDHEVREGIATFMTTPYTAAEWSEWLEGHQKTLHPAVVGLDPLTQRVLGWASLSPWSVRAAYARSVESSVYVAHDCHGQGIGKLLMQDILHRGREGGACVVIARVVEQNPGSVRFHEALGFQTIGIMRRVGEKFGQLLDVRLMDLHLDTPF